MKSRLRSAIQVFIAFASLAACQSVWAEPNPVKGAELFKQCIVCHAVGEGAADTVAPNLNHIFGRKAGTLEGFNYSKALLAKAASDDLIWSEKSIYIFLAGPERYIPGTTMGFKGLRREKEIKDLMAWLIQYSPAYEPGSGKLVDPAIASAATLPLPPSVAEEAETPDLSESKLGSAEVVSEGGVLWAKQCRHCHGDSAYPGKAPKLTPATYSADFVFDRVTNGFRKMPAWKSVFTLEQRTAVVAYVLSKAFSP